MDRRCRETGPEWQLAPDECLLCPVVYPILGFTHQIGIRYDLTVVQCWLLTPSPPLFSPPLLPFPRDLTLPTSPTMPDGPAQQPAGGLPKYALELPQQYGSSSRGPPPNRELYGSTSDYTPTLVEDRFKPQKTLRDPIFLIFFIAHVCPWPVGFQIKSKRKCR